MATTGTGTRAGQSPRTARPGVSSVGSTVDGGAGFVLGLFVWGWVVLPFLTGGVTGVRNVLRAKFFNKAADGSWLP